MLFLSWEIPPFSAPTLFIIQASALTASFSFFLLFTWDGFHIIANEPLKVNRFLAFGTLTTLSHHLSLVPNILITPK